MREREYIFFILFSMDNFEEEVLEEIYLWNLDTIPILWISSACAVLGRDIYKKSLIIREPYKGKESNNRPGCNSKSQNIYFSIKFCSSVEIPFLFGLVLNWFGLVSQLFCSSSISCRLYLALRIPKGKLAPMGSALNKPL